MNAENVIQEISRCNSKSQSCDAMHGYHSDDTYDTNGKDSNKSGAIINDIIASDSNSVTLSNDFPLSFLSEDDKVRLALRTSSAMRPGAYVENEIEGTNKPTTQEELWKHATYDHRRHEGGEYSSENNRYRPTNVEPACKHDEILGIQRSHESMVRLQECIEKNKSKVFCCFSRKQSWIFAALSIAIIILAISLTLIFTVGRGSHVIKDKDKNGTSSAGVNGYSLFDLNLCYSPDFLNNNNNDKFNRIRLAILKKFQSMESVIDNKYSKESLSLCWLAYFDEFEGKVEDDETELVQRFALAMIFFHFIGESNDSVLVQPLRREKWLDYTPVCEWSFVNCSNVSSESKSVNKITSLEISSMQLQGQLPSELALLSSLSRIHIQPNILSGSIPEEIWQLSNLEDLSIHENQFSGTFPSDVVQLSRLTNLIMKTIFTGTIPALNNLSNLKRLELSSSFFEGDFPSILQLSELDKLRLRSIGITGTIPLQIWSMPKLRYVHLLLVGAISLESINSSIIETIRIEYVRSGFLSPDLGNLSSLRTFSLIDTSIKGTVPSEIGKLSNLEKVVFVRNPYLTGTVPVEICNRLNGSFFSSAMAIECNCCNDDFTLNDILD